MAMMAMAEMATVMVTAMGNAATAANGNNVDDNYGGVSRTAIGQQQLDEDNGMTTM
jgi:hypothetical protein